MTCMHCRCRPNFVLFLNKFTDSAFSIFDKKRINPSFVPFSTEVISSPALLPIGKTQTPSLLLCSKIKIDFVLVLEPNFLPQKENGWFYPIIN